MGSISLSDWFASSRCRGHTHLSLTSFTNNNHNNNTPPRLAGLTFRWGSVASPVLTVFGTWLVKLGVSQSPVRSDATNIIFLSGAVFVCIVVSRWCVCVVRGMLSRLPRHRVHGRFLGSTVDAFSRVRQWMTCQSTETSAFSFRIQQRLGDSGYRGGGCGGGGTTAAELFKWAGWCGRRQVARRGRVQSGGASDPVHRQSVPRVVS